MNKKALISIAIMLCVSVSAYKLFDVYLDHTPVAEAGQCVEVQVDDETAILGILQNDDKLGTSVVIVLSTYIVGEITYRELRDLNAKQVTCPQ